MTNQEEQVVNLLKAIETREAAPLSVISRGEYIQHNPEVADGLEGFLNMIRSLPEGGAKVETLRVFQDGAYVVANSRIDIGGPLAVFDIFRFQSGEIVEHWDNAQPLSGPNPAGRTLLDGPTEPTDLDRTETNKTIGRQFVEDVLKRGQLDKISDYVDDDNYIQHHPLIGDGPDALKTAFQQWANEGITVRYDTIHHVLGKGSFVLVTSEGAFNGEPTAFYDLFRIEDNHVAEHWDTVQAIRPKAECRNSNGKF